MQQSLPMAGTALRLSLAPTGSVRPAPDCSFSALFTRLIPVPVSLSWLLTRLNAPPESFSWLFTLWKAPVESLSWLPITGLLTFRITPSETGLFILCVIPSASLFWLDKAGGLFTLSIIPVFSLFWFRRGDLVGGFAGFTSLTGFPMGLISCKL